MFDTLPYLLALPLGLGTAIAGRRYTTAFLARYARDPDAAWFRTTDPDPAVETQRRVRLVLSLTLLINLAWLFLVITTGRPPLAAS
jgi:hypothetical protein